MSKGRRSLTSSSSKNGNGNGHTNGYNRLEDILKNNSASLAGSTIKAEKSSKDLDLTMKSPVVGRTPNQKTYIKSIQDNDVTLCTGKAGCGKSHLSVGMAAKYLSEGKVDRIIFVRPAVPCEEDIGFLPGELKDKIGPFLVPVFEELFEFFSIEQIDFLTSGKRPKIIGVPLGMVKGRNWKRCFIVVDEAQDATAAQLKRLITRLIDGSTMVFNGDITQSDKFPNGKTDFEYFIEDLEGASDINVVRLTDKDNQRHPRMVEWINRLER